MMENSLNIEKLTNGLVTLQQVKQLYKKDKRSSDDGSDRYIQPDRLSLMRDILTTITDFVPQTRSNTFSNAFEQGIRFSSAYRELKRHVGSMNRNAPAQEDMFRTLKLFLPVLDMRQKVYMDKVVKIIDILMS
jgi:hypothetical protein